MEYAIHNLLPNPLKEQEQSINSDIWQTDCNLEKGKNYLLTAPSGKGKSTFLHILYGLRKDYSGVVELGGENISAFQPNEWADLRKAHLSIIFQDLRLFPTLSALDNILLKSSLDPIKSITAIKEMAARLGIEDLLQQHCNTLSYGQKQRVAIIRALCQSFDFLLLDEPFSHLDTVNIQAASQLIQEVCEEQKAGFVLVSLGERFGFKYNEVLVL